MGKEPSSKESSSGEQIASFGAEEEVNEQLVKEGTSQPTVSTASKPKKKTPRGSHNLKEFCYVVTRHSDRGRPVSPEKAQKTFPNTCGAIARKHCKITDEWNDINDVTRDLCFQDVHKRFQVSDEWRERFRAAANIALRRGLSNWKTTARKWLDKPYELVKKKWPSITDEAQWEQFKKESADPAFIAKSEFMKALRDKKKFNHRLGSAGKEGKSKIWRKQDRQLEAEGRVPPVHNMLQDQRAREYARQHMKPDEWAGKEPMQENVRNFAEKAHKWEENKAKSDCSVDSVQSKRWESAVTAGLEKAEHTGRVFGEGEGAAWDDYFLPAPKQSRGQKRKATDDEIIEQAKAEARVEARAEATLVGRDVAVMAVHHLLSAVAKEHPAIQGLLAEGMDGLRNLLPPLPPPMAPPKSSAFSGTRLEEEDYHTPGYSPARSVDIPASQPDPSKGIRDNDPGPSDRPR
ncbi:uncharacterized protein LOC100836756 [Brachypodium distachyon]|uniref:Uncharacterized protein n=1 Tax=Brachypodium distachyon TaxID=15368 RepID=A0A0Q3GEU2_BRADI|nr:uncharacterized protein LOC100836756 [Brachypodium distachyon]KQK08949.1 hypothetical protein BRADI_2g45041v3 [Brachypodium distachyon]|eukprot:XP_024314434.1 uncharacterized protein LOC100836756 [Brachypodium distachyon]